MNRQYLLDYINENDSKFYQNSFNVIQTPCGSGKTYFCMDVICNPNTKYTLNHCLYVTDTRALAESVRIDYENRTGMKASQWNWNLNVITYQTLANKIRDNQGVEWLSQYDYVFLDEIHQLFIYSKQYDSTRDESNAKYSLIIKNLTKLVEETTLVCLSATPKPLYDHIAKQNLSYMIHEVIPPTDIRKIKSYITQTTFKTDNLQEIAYNLKLDDDTKVFVFAQTINELKNYERIFRSHNYTTLALWNDKRYQEDEHKHKLTDYQLQAREKLLETGEFDEQVLLLNGAYESGINIEHMPTSEKKTVIVLVAHTDSIKIEQARGRIRHDIDVLYHTEWADNLYEQMGEENNIELCERLEDLVEECELEPHTFIGKDGLREIADICNLFTVVKHKQVQLTKMETINTRLRLLELPYEIQLKRYVYRENGKVKNFRYYIVVKTSD